MHKRRFYRLIAGVSLLCLVFSVTPPVPAEALFGLSGDVFRVNSIEEIERLLEWIYEFLTLFMKFFSAPEGRDLLGDFSGLPIPDKEKISGVVQGADDTWNPDDPKIGEESAVEGKERATEAHAILKETSDKGNEYAPAIITSDHPSFVSAMIAAIENTKLKIDKDTWDEFNKTQQGSYRQKDGVKRTALFFDAIDAFRLDMLGTLAEIASIAYERPTPREETSSPPVPPAPPVPEEPGESDGDWIWPLNGTITSGYGWRIHPISGKRTFHSGIDIGAATGAPIKAASGGRVDFVGWLRGYGNTVIVNHGNGYSTLYGHCSAFVASRGQQVSAGEVIAKVGSTGVATGPHLHYEKRKNGNHIDPGSPSSPGSGGGGGGGGGGGTDYRRERMDRSLSSTTDIPISDLMSPGEAIQRIMQELILISNLRAEIFQHYVRFADLNATKILMLSRLAAMTGENQSDAFYEAMRRTMDAAREIEFIMRNYLPARK